MIVRQKPSSLYQAPCSGASIALIGIDFRPETAEKIAPPCIARLDVDNCITTEINCILLLYSESKGTRRLSGKKRKWVFRKKKKMTQFR